MCFQEKMHAIIQRDHYSARGTALPNYYLFDFPADEKTSFSL